MGLFLESHLYNMGLNSLEKMKGNRNGLLVENALEVGWGGSTEVAEKKCRNWQSMHDSKLAILWTCGR